MLKETIFQFIILFEDKNLQQLNFETLLNGIINVCRCNG